MDSSGRTRKKRFIYNNDGTFILGNALHGGRLLTIEDVRDYVDLVAESQVTSFFVCTNSTMPYYPSRVERSNGCPPCNGDTNIELGTGKVENYSRFGYAKLELAVGAGGSPDCRPRPAVIRLLQP